MIKDGKVVSHMRWNDFDVGIEVLTRLIKASKQNIIGVYGIPRGGLVVAVALSHKLGVPLVETFAEVRKGVLVVDDINETGRTLENYVKDVGEGKYNLTATLYQDNGTKFWSTFDAFDSTGKWIVFPWETDESSKADWKEA